MVCHYTSNLIDKKPKPLLPLKHLTDAKENIFSSPTNGITLGKNIRKNIEVDPSSERNLCSKQETKTIKSFFDFFSFMQLDYFSVAILPSIVISLEGIQMKIEREKRENGDCEIK